MVEVRVPSGTKEYEILSLVKLQDLHSDIFGPLVLVAQLVEGLLSADSREKHTAEPMQFGTPPALFRSFGECFCLLNCLKSFRGTIR